MATNDLNGLRASASALEFLANQEMDQPTMLYIRRVAGQTIYLGDDVEIAVIHVGEHGVTLGLSAPTHVEIRRGEIVSPPANTAFGLERQKSAADFRHKRRALSADEVVRLIASARESGVSIQRFNGELRARIYILSFMTGLRGSEIASLTPRSFALDAEPPTVTVEAVSADRGRKEVLPLHPDLVVLVRSWVAGLPPTEKLFQNLNKCRTWLMVKKDLERVGIPYETADGVADFHSVDRRVMAPSCEAAMEG